MKPKNVIEINGKMYDAKTGVPLHATKTAKPIATTASRTKAKPVTKKLAGRSVDGFTARPRNKANNTASVAAKKTNPTPQVKKQTPASRTAPGSVKLKAKRSTTLNRTIVKKPSAAPKNTSTAAKNKAVISSPALRHASPARSTRATQVTKSTAISKFATKKLDSAKQSPELTTHLVKTHANTENTTAKQTSDRLSTKEQLIKKALDQTVITSPAAANSSRKKNRKPHVMRYATTALTVLVLAGYVAYLNVPSISIKVAAHRAGFAANLPAHKPAGYSLKGPIAYSPGQVTLNFASNTDQRKFSLTQQPTTWDSTALLENFVSKKSPNYVTYQDSGLTIYITDTGDAAWVNGGKFYQVKAENTQLDTDQLLKLATSV